MDGQYYARMPTQNPFGDHICYSYSISSPPILGFDITILIGLAIAVAAILELIVFLPKHSNKKKQFNNSL